MTTKECKELSGDCYVLPSGVHHEILMRKGQDNFSLYPERHMSLHTLAHKFLPPPNVDVLTENPWIIGSYDFRSVYILNKEGKWENPEEQTFGTSIETIMSDLLGISTSISRLPSVMLDELLGR